MRLLGCLVSLLTGSILCIVELHKIDAVVDAENKRVSSYNTCDRINKLRDFEFKLIVLFLAAQIFYLSYLSFLVVSLFVYEIREREAEGFTISALDFFKRKRTLKVKMFCKVILYVFLVYRYFFSLIVNKT